MGSPKSSARMGRAESEVGSTAAELQFFSIFLMNAIAYFDSSKSVSEVPSDERATGTEPRALLGTVFPPYGGVREGLLFCRVVRLLQRAEECCEGLKHGYYDLPCIHFLIFLCHDIKNKISQD